MVHIFLFFMVFATLGCRYGNSNQEVSGFKTARTYPSDMQYVQICDQKKVCKNFSRLIMGTDHLAQSNWTKEGQPEPTEEQVFEILDEAVKLGINFFDTSPIYAGNVENKVGKWLKSRRQTSSPNPDSKLYVLSKGGFPFDLFYFKRLPAGPHSNELTASLKSQGIMQPDASPLPDGSVPLTEVPPGTYASRLFGSKDIIQERIAEELGHTGNNLNQDLTIYLMHRDDHDFIKFQNVSREQTPVQDIMEVLGQPELASKYWMVGWSNWQTKRVNESILLSSKNPDLPKPALNSAYFSLFEMSSRSIHAGGVQVTHDEMMNPNFQKGIFQSPYSPLGGFSVLDQPEPKWENAKKAAKIKFDAGDAYWQNVYNSIFTEANRSRYDRAVKFTAEFNKKNGTNFTIDQTLNAYALAHKRTDFLTIGPITIEQLRRTHGALKYSRMLTEKDLSYLYRGR
jgi:aryl-alcohol dehydrogenase-like predicted oxidoreductase